MRRTHRERVEELYADDPFVSPAEYGRFVEEADELDRIDSESTKLHELALERDAERESEPA